MKDEWVVRSRWRHGQTKSNCLTHGLIFQLNFTDDGVEIGKLLDLYAARRDKWISFEKKNNSEERAEEFHQKLYVPLVPAGSSLIYYGRDGHAVETEFVVANVTDLIANPFDMGRNG